jgi:hypothetical protein
VLAGYTWENLGERLEKALRNIVDRKTPDL